jgi:hypothetical protein
MVREDREMQTAFSYEFRVLLCHQCGGPIDAALTAGSFTCSYCGVTMVLTPRKEAREVIGDTKRSRAEHDAAGATEKARLDRLRAQPTRTVKFPPALETLAKGSMVAPSRLDEALALWNRARARLVADPSETNTESFYAITFALSNTFSLANDPRRHRAMLETALEVLPDAWHRQAVRCSLAALACREGDVAAAEAWLALCDDQPEDLAADSEYRVARAKILTRKGEHSNVLEVLGHDDDALPFTTELSFQAAVFRANAHEQLGDLDAAAKCLFVYALFPNTRKILKIHSSYDLCARSYSRALRKAILTLLVTLIVLSGGVALLVYLIFNVDPPD